MAFLKPDKIRTEHGLVINEKIIPWGAVWKKNWKKYKKGDKYKADRLLSNGTGKVKYITIHNTEDINEAKGTDDAEQYTRATYPNQNMGTSRVHYYIDESSCWQNLREDEVGWHAGDSRGPGNETSLGIEIIMDGTGSKPDTEAEERGALLAAILLDRHGLGIDKLVPHKHWTGKICPAYILPHWLEFESKVKKYLKQIQAKQPEPEAAFTPYLIKVTAKGALNIRKGAGTNYAKVGSIKGDALKYAYTIIEEKDGKGATKWGKLKSGAGWISLDYTKRV